jgi:beta-galactosidase
MKQNNTNKITWHVGAIVTVLLFLAGNIACYGQGIDKTERKQLFDNNWKFFQGDTISAKSRDFSDMSWRNLDLPHDWSIEGKISPKNPMGRLRWILSCRSRLVQESFQSPG